MSGCSARCKGLRDLGNTVIVVEHDEDTIRAADHVIDLGPRAGRFGGEVVAEGTIDRILAHPDVAHGALPARRAAHQGPGAAGARATPSAPCAWWAPGPTT